MLKGIDVSRWQGQINWPVVKQNVDFAIIKIGGSDDGFYPDGRAQTNVIEARSAGLPIWFYVFLGGVQAISEEVQHIKNLVSMIGGLKNGEVVCLDWERRRAGHDEVGYLTGIVEGMGRAGFPSPPIYMNLNYVRTQNWQNLVTRNCALWVAAWGNNDAIPDAVPGSDEWPFWAVWQYSSTGSVPGIAGRVDLNHFNGTIEQFKQYGNGGGGNVSLPVQVPIPPPVLPASGFSEYTVQAGDSLSGIAGRYRKTWQELWALNRDRVAEPNKIFPGQKLKLWSGAAASNPQLPTPTHQPVIERVHVVENGENLSVIAAKYGLSSWRTLYDMNKGVIGENPSLIKPGQRLRLP